MELKYQRFYHLYNHAISNESLFQNDNNFNFFLTKYHYYLQPVVKTFAYCLMPNHFHFLIQIKDENQLIEYFKTKITNGISGNEDLHGFLQYKLSKQFSNFFNSYAKAFNKMYAREGKLFRNSMKFKEIDNTAYLKNLIQYIHLNPVMHGFVRFAEEWAYSSYNQYTDTKKQIPENKVILDLFGGETGFKTYHLQAINEQLIMELEF